MAMLNLFNLAFAWIVLPLILLITKYAVASRRPKNFPPGPPGLPIIGNLHQLPVRKGFLKQHEWTKEYGSIIGLKLGPLNAVVLNSHRHVSELVKGFKALLFDKRGAIYSGRPENYVGRELICPNEIHILLAQYGAGWRTLRKSVQGLLNVAAVDALHPIQTAEATQTMCQLLDDPAGYYDHIRRYSTAVILASVFGQRGESFQSPKVQALYHAQDRFTAILETGATPPVDAFPFLKATPEFLSPWKKEANGIRQEQSSLYFKLLDETRDRIRKGNSTSCFMEKLMDDQEKIGFSDEQVAYLGGILMEAGSDTTSSTLLTFVLAMTQNPGVLRKAQEEVDRICSSEKSPTFDDIGQLEYLSACMNETLRWRPIAPGGIPHMLIQDDNYGEYFLPKGTILFANTWAIHMDESEYEEPDRFLPERFLGNKFGSKTEVTDKHRRTTYGFGAGRRVCPGQKLAENSLMLNIAKMVWLFDIKSTSAAPLDVSMSSAFSDGFIVAPKKFPVEFVPRSDKRVQVIRDEFEKSEEYLGRFGKET
ncbi:uncharacterized protein N7503_000338 [Penicillium pulvis]|uniref:uncharacterized protein n=1 Tax=Penicillium pulvis TaxID=1562058 RepID=UPI0025470EDF|nr:uncharacterized protein N7503_000338 [Penicillium pulvis]KAJ5813588.1 hypothetical protein N7503_000338 [Penicillium pulvis]